MMFRMYLRTLNRLVRLRTVLILLVLAWTSGAQAAGTAIQIDLEGALGVATSEFIIDGIETAQAQDANLIIIRMTRQVGS